MLMMEKGVSAGRISMGELAWLLCESPARQYGLYPRKGALRVGSDADIVLWDPRMETRISAATQAQRTDYTPYEGVRIRGGVRGVWLRGKYAVQDGKLVMPGLGAYLERNFACTK